MGGWGGYRNNATCGVTPGTRGGMMWQYRAQAQVAVEPLSVEQSVQAVNNFLSAYGNPDLVLAEVMIFDNHAYAEIVETSTGIGAMELLVDPITLAVTPEYGPNMMWNLKYGHMRGGMMGGFGRNLSASAEMSVSPQEAVEAARAYLERFDPQLSVTDHVDSFYGYYTLHTYKDGALFGMLSVNGYTAEVFVHTWHGALVEVQEFEED